MEELKKTEIQEIQGGVGIPLAVLPLVTFVISYVIGIRLFFSSSIK